MNDEIIISSIVVCYGFDERIFKTLDSIFMQEFKGIELIISDDGSSNFDRQKLEEYIKKNKTEAIVSYIIMDNKVNVGTVRNLNRAIRQSSGKYIKLIGDDIYHDSNVFSRQCEYLDNSNCSLVTGFAMQADADGNKVSDSRIDNTNNSLECIFSSGGEEAFKYYLKNGYSPLVTQAACYRREFFENYGYFDEDFTLVEDSPMGARVVLNKVSVGVQKEYSVIHIVGEGVSTSKIRYSKSRLVYYRDVLKYAEKYMLPNRKALGKGFVRYRYRLVRFRVEYCENKLTKNSKLRSLGLLIKYFDTLVRYALKK